MTTNILPIHISLHLCFTYRWSKV